MSNSFGEFRVSVSEAKTKLHVINNLKHFINQNIAQGAFDKNEIISKINFVFDAINAEFLKCFLYENNNQQIKKDQRENVLISFFEEYDDICQMYFKEIVPPVEITKWEEEKNVILARYGNHDKFINEYQNSTDTKPSVEGALKLAWHNVERSGQRWASWICLGRLFNNVLSLQRQSIEYKNFQDVYNYLLNDLQNKTQKLFALAIIKGGVDLDKVKNKILNTSFAPEMSIISYLTIDGYTPNGWSVADENAFREDVNSYRMKGEV